MTSREGERQELKLSEAAQTLVEECRMVLPGVQAIFGFQLIAVFQQKFGEDLDKPYQYLHLAALTLVAVAAAVIMTPAAYHRIQNPREVTGRFIRISSRLLLAALAILAAGLALDVFILARLVLENDATSAALAASVLGVMLFMWYVFPRVSGRGRE